MQTEKDLARQVVEQRRLTDRQRYKRLKANGICTLCKHESAVPGKTYCEKCREKKKAMSKADYTWAVENGFCRRCKKVKVYENEHYCPDCLTLIHAQVRKARPKGRDKEYERKHLEKGLCRKCTRPLAPGYTMCQYHINKYRKGTNIRHDWLQYGKCYICGGEVVSGKKLCEKHLAIVVKNLTNRKPNPYWKLKKVSSD